jgi:hypothetical protein
MRNPLGRGYVATFRWPSPRSVTIAPNCPSARQLVRYERVCRGARVGTRPPTALQKNAGYRRGSPETGAGPGFFAGLGVTALAKRLEVVGMLVSGVVVLVMAL